MLRRACGNTGRTRCRKNRLHRCGGASCANSKARSSTFCFFALVGGCRRSGSVKGRQGCRSNPSPSRIILLLNAGLGVYQESKSEAALAQLKELAAPLVWVMRDGKLVHLSSADLVPGDLVRIEAGDRIPADGT